MKFGVISDIHANYTALLAVLEEFERRRVDRVICLGDIIGIGPQPEECVLAVAALQDAIVVMGNHETMFVDGPSADEYAAMSKEEVLHHRWQYSRMKGAAKMFLLNLPYKTRFSCEGVTITVSHYALSPRNEFLHTLVGYNRAEVQQSFGMDSDIYLFGHDHTHFIKEYAGQAYICVGSLGCPATDLGIALAGILEVDNGDYAYDCIEVPYDIKQVVRRVKELRYPDSDFVCSAFYHTK